MFIIILACFSFFKKKKWVVINLSIYHIILSIFQTSFIFRIWIVKKMYFLVVVFFFQMNKSADENIVLCIPFILFFYSLLFGADDIFIHTHYNYIIIHVYILYIATVICTYIYSYANYLSFLFIKCDNFVNLPNIYVSNKFELLKLKLYFLFVFNE